MAFSGRFAVSRRDCIRDLVRLSTAAIASGSVARSAGTGADWTPAVLNPEENEALISLGESIVPGSREALCSRIVDLVLTQEEPSVRLQLSDALASFDREARRRFQQRFTSLNSAQHDAILTDSSEKASPLHEPFSIVKEWTADAYWSSAQGLRELGSTGRMAWDSFPDCRHPAPHN